MSFVPKVTIDLDALRHNLSVVRHAAPRSKVMAVIKADAYGHGMVRIAEALDDADALAVARVGEAASLRAAGILKRLVVLAGCLDAQELKLASQLGLELVVHSQQQVRLLAETKIEIPLRCWLKVDTGMGRLGFLPEEFERVYAEMQGMDSIKNPVRLMTHLASSDEPENSFTENQVNLFQSVTKTIKTEKTVANSAGILHWPMTHGDWVRPGLMLYGASPFAEKPGNQYNLRPVMTFAARLMAVKSLSKGDTVGYGRAWTCPEDMRVGVVSAGYADGYPREVSGAELLLNGGRVPVIGRVSMDMINIDLRSQPDAKVGDEVILWGLGLPVEDIARAAATIPYTLFCGIGSRVQYLASDDPVSAAGML